MRVLYDLRGNQSRAFAERGIPRYVNHHVAALAERPEIAELHGMVDPGRDLPPVLGRLAGRGWAVAPESAPQLLEGTGPLVHHVGSPFELDLSHDRLLPPALDVPGVVRVVTLYDVIPLAVPRDLDWVQRLWTTRAEVLRSADMVVAISEHTAEDGIARLGLDERRVRVIGTGVPQVGDAAYHGAAGWPDIPGLAPGYVLYTGGTNDPRKNLPRLVRGFGRMPEELRAGHQLVITSKIHDHDRENLERVAAEAGVADRLLFTGYVPDDVLHRMFRNCACFVYPSLYEGFGLPIVEAMSYGAPVVRSDATSCGEIPVEPGASFDPRDEDAIGAAIARVLADPAYAERLAAAGRETARGYTWAAVAERTAGGGRPRSRPRRPPPAVLAPPGPSPRGVHCHHAGRRGPSLRLAADARARRLREPPCRVPHAAADPARRRRLPRRTHRARGAGPRRPRRGPGGTGRLAPRCIFRGTGAGRSRRREPGLGPRSRAVARRRRPSGGR